MKILLVNTHLDPETGGGYFRRTMELARAFRELGHDVTLLATDFRFGDAASSETKGYRVRLFKTLFSRFFVPRWKRSELESVIREADLVHLMGFWSILNVVVAREARRQNVPFVLCPAGALPAFGRSKFLKSVFKSIFESLLIGRSAYVAAITKREADEMQSDGVSASKLRVLPNGVPPEFFESLDPAPFREKYDVGTEPYILFVGRLNPIKGPDLLLKGFVTSQASERGYKLVFAGPDEGMKRGLEEQARAEGVRLVFTGFLDGEEKRRAYAGCAFLAVPSRSEAMSLVALEAGACGRPVLLTDQCGFDEVAATEGGEIVPADSNAIASALDRMTSLPKSTLDEMGRRLQKLIRSEFTWPKIAQSMLHSAGRAP